MAIGGVVVNFTLKTRDAIQDALKLSRSLENTSDEADDLDRSLNNVQGEIDQTGRAARDLAGDVEPAERSFEQLSREVSDSAQKMRQDMGKMSGAVRDGASDVDREASKMQRDMGELGSETGSEFISNIAEGIGSGQANLNDIVSGTLGGLTNLAATLTGPVGLAAGAAAAGIGLTWGKMRAEAEKAAEQVQTLIGVLQDTEGEAKKVRDQKVFDEWLAAAQQLPDELGLIVDGMKKAGVKATDFKDAIAGSGTAQEKVIGQLQTQIDLIDESAEGEYGLTYEQQKYRDGLVAAIGEIKKQNTNLDDAQNTYDDINWLQGKSVAKTKENTAETKKWGDEADRVSDKLDDAARDRSMKVKVSYAMGSGPGAGGGGGGGNGGYPNMASSRASAQPPAPVVVPPTVIVTEEQVYRAITSLIMRGDARNGRIRIA